MVILFPLTPSQLLTYLENVLSLIIKTRGWFEMLLHKTCSSPGSKAGKFRISFFKMKTFLLSHIQPLCLSLFLSAAAPFFILCGLLYKSQLAGPWRTRGLMQESYFCPSLHLFVATTCWMLCSPEATQPSLTTSVEPSAWQRKHRGKVEMRPKWQG